MNKNLLVVSLLVLSSLNGFSQSKKNDLKLTVSALPLFGSSDGFESGINGFVIKPSFGYFISDNTSIDLNFSYASLNNLRVDTIDSYYNSYAFIPTLRNNFVNNQKLRIFAEFGFGLGTIKYNADNTNLRTTSHRNLSGGISILNIGLGGNYFFNEKFGIELIIPYLSTRNITSENSNNLYSGIGPTVGFTYVLN
jgi:outer membrane protein W